MKNINNFLQISKLNLKYNYNIYYKFYEFYKYSNCNSNRNKTSLYFSRLQIVRIKYKVA